MSRTLTSTGPRRARPARPLTWRPPELTILEDRTVPDGTVAASVLGGVLYLKGDDLYNNIQIEQIAANRYRVTGLDGTTVTGVNGAGEIGGAIVHVNVQLKGGKDVVHLTTVTDAGESFTIPGSLTVANGDGDNSLYLAYANLGGSLIVTNGDGYDTLSVYNTHLNVNGGMVSVTNGIGGSRTSFTGDFVDTRGITVVNGAGDDAFEVSAGDVGIHGVLYLANGEGSSQTYLFSPGDLEVGMKAPPGYAGTSIQVLNGSGNDSFTLEAAHATVTGTVSINNGIGYSYVYLGDRAGDEQPSGVLAVEGEGLTIGGSVIVTTGNDSANSRNFYLGGSDVAVAGNVLVTNGNGSAQTLLGWWDYYADRGTLHVGGRIAVTNGAGQHYFGLAGGEVTVGGSVTVTNGAGYSETWMGTPYWYYYGEVSDTLHVGGGVTVTNGDGSDYVALVAGDLVVGGTLAIANGTGGSETRIGGMPYYWYTEQPTTTTIKGGFRLTAGAGDDYLYLDGKAVSIGQAATVDLGQGTAQFFTDYSSTVKTLTTVGGALSFRNLGATNLLLQGLTVTGGTTLTTGDLADFVAIHDSTFRGAFLLATGGGNDKVAIEQEGVLLPVAPAATTDGGQTTTQFLSSATFRLGTGDDWLEVGSGVGSPHVAQFNPLFPVTLDGGTGGDTLGFLGWGNSYGKAFLGTPSSWEVLLPPPVVLPAPPGPAPGP